MKKGGYLLMELLIALTMAMMISYLVALLQASLVCWHKEAEQYFMATVIAQKVLAYLHTGSRHPSIPQGFKVTLESTTINPQVPFILDIATVSFTTPRNIPKEIVMVAGRHYAKE